MIPEFMQDVGGDGGWKCVERAGGGLTVALVCVGKDQNWAGI